MSIIEKKDKFDITTEDLKPKSIKLKILQEQHETYKSLLNVAKELKEATDKNVKLALQLSDLRKKYSQIKREYNEVVKKMNKYYIAERDLNIKNIPCPFLNEDITLIQCNQACNFGYCDVKHECRIRIQIILEQYDIKYTHIMNDNRIII